jgi:signal transduction histidine kinase
MRWRVLAVILVWGLVAAWSSYYFTHNQKSARFDFFSGPNGRVSVVQYEEWFHNPQILQPGDRVVAVEGRPLSLKSVRNFLKGKKSGDIVKIRVERDGKEQTVSTKLKRHSRQSVLTLFVIPLALSLIFLVFAIGVLLQRGAKRTNREAVIVFSSLCMLLSLVFLGLFPMLTFGAPIGLSLVVPLLSFALVHLSMCYPKQKGQPWLRRLALGGGYGVAAVLSIFKSLEDLHMYFVALCFILAMGIFGNTVFTSRDFWARRRARLLSVVLFVSFLAVSGIFVAFVWEGPRISIERILAISLIFPSAFLAIFLKSNVLEIERAFRRGLHQVALITVAATFALLVGLGWSSWFSSSGDHWMLWVAISIVVIALARPVSNWIEESIHTLIKTKVKYPSVNTFFEEAHSLEEFLNKFFAHCETFLAMKDLQIRFFKDPTRAWTAENEEIWTFEAGHLYPQSSRIKEGLYRNILMRGDVAIGEIHFDGGDQLAFDPATSAEWAEVLILLSRCLEALALREFIALQQGLLAVGRMQALLAHELKNPLAIIKVCSGLLKNRLKADEEAEELVETIQNEVKRVTSTVQGIFDQSGKVEHKEKVLLDEILYYLKDQCENRFPDRELQIERRGFADTDALILWTEKESFRQALLNLVMNAFEVGSPWVKVALILNGDQFSIEVSDKGPGLPQNVDIFKPFVTTKPSGTGLGLAQVMSFVDRNHAHIKTQSQPDSQGATFNLVFSSGFVLNGVDHVSRL